MGKICSDNLENEAERASELLKGKVVANVWRHKANELMVQFTDGTRLFVDMRQSGLELSITGES